ncbi:hypothetical protein DEFDS_P042 (plasmid) [Deferribacter desulfuricans SSM1]|uniref:Calcineurin-like phosphoesterase domain-containing protein n=1 Tax=Deferribacter desulfuricans (strain DSM 14783 / JCM 11476 / NBRC 101012 / SSM1) TaxID=639282 RepID=D3PEM5_DEFDS|nr:metallophosphoesterase [Deferribacter desulfuricans]BAI81667.1 hypothetical protein DEFDS_P042 [Deferribacter desulfuricans SSM1]
MKCLIIGDRHVYIDTYDIYLEQRSALLSWLRENTDIDFIVETGDFFHLRKTVSKKFISDVLQKEFEFFTELKNINPELIYYKILGNHDILSENMDSLLKVFNYLDNVEIIDHTKEVDFSYKHKGVFVPYLNSLDSIDYKELENITSNLDTKNINILFSHNFPYFIGGNDIVLPKKVLNKYQRVFLGHYHNYIQKDNVVIVGSTHQVRIDEYNVNKYVFVYDLDTNQFTKFELPYTKYKEIIIQNEHDLQAILSDPTKREQFEKDVRDNYVILKVSDLNLYNQIESSFNVVNAHLKLDQNIIDNTLDNLEDGESDERLLNIEEVVTQEVENKIPLYFSDLTEQDKEELKNEILQIIYQNLQIPHKSIMDKQLVFDKLELKNFIIADDITIDFNELKNDLYFVKGLKLDDVKSDSNGAGKSLLFVKSILYCLYGKSRLVSDKQLFNERSGYVKLTIRNNYTGDVYEIERGIKKEKGRNKDKLVYYVQIFKNGVNISHKEKQATQKIIEDEILNKRLLTNLYILDGSSFTENFFNLEPSKQIEFLSELTLLDFIDTVNETLTEILKGSNKKSSDNSLGILGKKEQLQSQLQLLRTQLEEENEETIQKQMTEINKQIEIYHKEKQKQLEELSKEAESYKKTGLQKKQELQIIQQNLSKLDHNLKEFLQQAKISILSHIEKNVDSIENIQNKYKNLQDDYNKQLKEADTKWTAYYNNTNSKIQKFKKELNEKIALISKNKATIQSNNKLIQQYLNKIKEFEQKKFKEGDLCNTCKTELKGNALKNANSYLEQEIVNYTKEVNTLQEQNVALENQIPVLEADIRKLESLIKEGEDRINTAKERYILKKESLKNEFNEKGKFYKLIFNYIDKVNNIFYNFSGILQYPQDIVGLDTVISDLNNQYNKLQQDILKGKELYTNKKSELDIIHNKYAAIINQINIVKNQENPHDRSLKLLKRSLDVVKQKREQVKKLEKELTKIIREETKIRLLLDIFSKKGLKQKLLRRYLNALSNIFKQQILSYGSGSIEFTERNGKLNVLLYHRGKLKNFNDLSSGEKVRYIMAFHESIAILFQKIYNLSCNIRTYDEILANLDTIGTSEILKSIRKAIKNENIKVFLIDHTGLKDIFNENIIYVCNYNNKVHYINNKENFIAWVYPYYRDNKILNNEVKFYINNLLQNIDNLDEYVKNNKNNTLEAGPDLMQIF